MDGIATGPGQSPRDEPRALPGRPDGAAGEGDPDAGQRAAPTTDPNPEADAASRTGAVGIDIQPNPPWLAGDRPQSQDGHMDLGGSPVTARSRRGTGVHDAKPRRHTRQAEVVAQEMGGT